MISWTPTFSNLTKQPSKTPSIFINTWNDHHNLTLSQNVPHLWKLLWQAYALWCYIHNNYHYSTYVEPLFWTKFQKFPLDDLFWQSLSGAPVTTMKTKCNQYSFELSKMCVLTGFIKYYKKDNKICSATNCSGDNILVYSSAFKNYSLEKLSVNWN